MRRLEQGTKGMSETGVSRGNNGGGEIGFLNEGNGFHSGKENCEKQALLREKFIDLRNKEKLEETISFGEYLDRIEENPDICQLSHARVYNMIKDAGIENNEDGMRKFNFFEGQIFGLDPSLNKIFEYFEASAKRTEIRKRVLLLVGPVSGGKSTIAALLKKGLEKYSRTENGAVYAIEGCPMQEEPLHLIPEPLRDDFKEMYGVHIEGDLCPSCQQKLEEKDGDYEEFSVKRIDFSEKKRRGIGTFLPSDPKSQDISALTGSIDFSTIAEFGSESDPRAYKFDGELNKANRGLMEYIEMLKADEKFHYTLLTLTQEQQIKIDRFPLTYADEVILSHTNENEYKAFLANKKSEALRDRVYPIYVPYNLAYSDEVKIYEKLFSSKESALKIGKNPELGETHISPLTLEVAAKLAVLSRFEQDEGNAEVKKIDPMKKLKLYNGEEVEGFSQRDVESIKKASPREGMDGISPRYVVNRLAVSISSSRRRDGKYEGTCITPITAIRELRDGLLESASFTEEEKKHISEKLLPEVRKDFDEKAKKEVQKAFIGGHEDHASAIMDDYLENVDAFCHSKKIKDRISGEEIEPNEKAMRSIEEQIGITELQKKGFRQEIMIRVGSLALENRKFDYRSHAQLREAIEKKVLEDYKEIIKTTLTARVKNTEQSGRLDKVVQYLIDKQGYCNNCASELTSYVADLYKKE